MQEQSSWLGIGGRGVAWASQTVEAEIAPFVLTDGQRAGELVGLYEAD